MLDKSAIDKIEELVRDSKLIHNIDGINYSRWKLSEIREEVDYAETLNVCSLTAIADYLTNIREKLGDYRIAPLFIHICSPSEVRLVSTLDDRMNRDVIIKAISNECKFGFANSYSIERFIVELQASFAPTDTLSKILALVGNIEKQTSVKTEDDGITQTVQAKTGISLKQEAKIPNPVILAPYRTFPEINQPESPFIFRISDGRDGQTLSLTQVDDPVWRQSTVNEIKGWFIKRDTIPVIG